jgi:hypothetical protein
MALTSAFSYSNRQNHDWSRTQQQIMAHVAQLWREQKALLGPVELQRKKRRKRYQNLRYSLFFPPGLGFSELLRTSTEMVWVKT